LNADPAANRDYSRVEGFQVFALARLRLCNCPAGEHFVGLVQADYHVAHRTESRGAGFDPAVFYVHDSGERNSGYGKGRSGADLFVVVIVKITARHQNLDDKFVRFQRKFFASKVKILERNYALPFGTCETQFRIGYHEHECTVGFGRSVAYVSADASHVADAGRADSEAGFLQNLRGERAFEDPREGAGSAETDILVVLDYSAHFGNPVKEKIARVFVRRNHQIGSARVRDKPGILAKRECLREGAWGKMPYHKPPPSSAAMPIALTMEL
jgi:hypothetical protein